MLDKINRQLNLNDMLSTDEESFTREGIFNVHDTHVWADENPYAIPIYGNRVFSNNFW
jgi:hypothetical protein